MIFNKVSIGELVTLRQGFAINKNTKHHMSDEPTDLHLLRIGDMKDGSYSIYVKDTIPAHFIANEDDIIYTRTGQVGLVFRKQHGVIHNNCFSVTPQNEDVLDRGFLFYVLQTKEFYEEANSKASGAAQPDLPHGAFNSISIPIPDIDIQRKISNILKSYDDLIENNQKQIKLLEEAAQRLYKEWFVDFRFLGYENMEIDNGIPTGWHMGTLGEIVEFRRGKTITKAQVKEGNVPVVAGGLEPAYYHNEANTKAPVITVSGSGANAGFSRMYHEDVFASDCSFADIQGTKYISFVYCFLKANKYQLDALQKGSAQPHVYAKDINAMEMLIPQSELITHYCAKADVLFNKIGLLQKQMSAASEARDRLLPKLMSGEIEV